MNNQLWTISTFSRVVFSTYLKMKKVKIGCLQYNCVKQITMDRLFKDRIGFSLLNLMHRLIKEIHFLKLGGLRWRLVNLQVLINRFKSNQFLQKIIKDNLNTLTNICILYLIRLHLTMILILAPTLYQIPRKI